MALELPSFDASSAGAVDGTQPCSILVDVDGRFLVDWQLGRYTYSGRSPATGTLAVTALYEACICSSKGLWCCLLSLIAAVV